MKKKAKDLQVGDLIVGDWPFTGRFFEVLNVEPEKEGRVFTFVTVVEFRRDSDDVYEYSFLSERELEVLD